MSKLRVPNKVFKQPSGDIDEPPKLRLKALANDVMNFYKGLASWQNKQLTATVSSYLSKDILKALHMPPEDILIVQHSLLAYMDKELTTQRLISIATKFVGNAHVLRAGYSLPTWTVVTQPHWTPVRVVNIEPVTKKSGKRFLHLYLFSLLGESAGTEIHQVLPSSYITGKLLRDIGLPKYNTYKQREILSMWFSIFLERDSNLNTVIKNISVNSAQTKHNKEIYKGRDICPYNYNHPCDKCLKGTDTCKYALYVETRVMRTCINGHEGLFNKKKDEKKKKCIQCRKQQR